MSEQTQFRCAIYTRKSSEEGLDQDFNSLEAQREACEAYIRSQAHEGWKLIPDQFDDGGFSGGNMERPALGRLMAQLRDGKIDIIVIYKIDRLTRSLTDFARLAETFDKHKVSFVSVTQQFNTTTSMGRLMLNVLLSFAQFEREITGERIRDKIGASKKKGMWMGGVVPMGYQARERQLFIDAEEAVTIRRVFQLYLEVGTVPALLERLHGENILTATRLSASARKRGNRHFTRGHLYKLLSNPIYIGRVPHKTVSHPGRHEPIIDPKTWASVQAQLACNTQGPRDRRRRAAPETHLLAERLFSDTGNRFIPTHANKGSRRYRYYVEDVPQGTTPRRLPAREIEAAVCSALRLYLNDSQQVASDLDEIAADQVSGALKRAKELAQSLDQSTNASHGVTRDLLARVRFADTEVKLDIARAQLLRRLGIRQSSDAAIHPSNQDEQSDIILFRAPVAIRRRGPQLKLAVAGQNNGAPDTKLIAALAKARGWAERLATGEVSSIGEIAKQEQIGVAYVSRTLPLAYLAPSIVEGILRGTFARDVLDTATSGDLRVLSWKAQSAALGITI